MTKKKTTKKVEKPETKEQPDTRLVDVCQAIAELREQLEKTSKNSGVRVMDYSKSTEELLALCR